MIPIIVPIVTSSDDDPYRRRPNAFGILLSVVVLSLGIFLALFLFLTGEFSSPIAIMGIIVLFFTISLLLVAFTALATSERVANPEREENYHREPLIKEKNKFNRNSEYCPECGTLVEFSDNFCTTCGLSLDGWK